MSSEEGVGAAQADSFVRPLPRRRARMARPPRVRIRILNPWVLFRFRLLGWYVRFIVSFADHAVDSNACACTRPPGARGV